MTCQFPSQWRSRIPTPRISHASTTWFQSRSVILKADHGICFTMWLSWCNVVIGYPQMSRISQLAENPEYKKLRMWKWINKTCLMEIISLSKHVKGSPPADIAMQGDFHSLRESTSNLSALEVLDMLSRCLDLMILMWERYMAGERL